MKTAISKQTSRRLASACLAALAGFAVTATSFAGPGATALSDGVTAIHVRFDDLNLSTDSGVSVLYQRIVSAARQVCPDADVRDLAAFAANHQCKADAIARAVHEIHNTQLALVHATRTGRG